MNISPHLLIDAGILSIALTITLVLRAKGKVRQLEKSKKVMITKKEETEYGKPKLFKIWNFLIYGSFIAIGAFLVYLYSAYIFINK